MWIAEQKGDDRVCRAQQRPSKGGGDRAPPRARSFRAEGEDDADDQRGDREDGASEDDEDLEILGPRRLGQCAWSVDPFLLRPVCVP